MPEQVLHRPHVRAALEQVRRERVPERVACHPALDPCSLRRFSNSALDRRRVEVVTVNQAGLGIGREARRREEELPAELTCRTGILAAVRVRKGGLAPDDWAPGRVLRVEVRFDHLGKEFGRTVTIGDLCTRAFYKEASARWLRWVLGVRVRDGVWTVPRGGRTGREIRDIYADAGITLTGGLAAFRQRIDAARRAGALASGQASRQRKWADDVSTAGSTPTVV